MLIKRMTSQKGAMFGLDARIALAIFGGLSVIAGTAVFGSISETQTTALTTEFDNFSKAYINFVLDTGVDTNDFMDLVNDDNNIINWKGPYVTISSDSHLSYGTYGLVKLEDSGAGAPPPACDSGDICAIWLRLTEVPDEIAVRVDEAIDGDNGGTGTSTTGNLRVEALAGSPDTVYYKLSRAL